MPRCGVYAELRASAMLNGHNYVAHCFLWIVVLIFSSKLEVLTALCAIARLAGRVKLVLLNLQIISPEPLL